MQDIIWHSVKGGILKKLTIWLSALFLTLSFHSIASNIKQEKIADNLHILSGKEYGTNIGLISTEEGVVIIDPMPGERNLAELDEIIKSTYDNSNTFILNTHKHADHTGGNEFFIKRGGTLIGSEFDFMGIKRVELKSHSSTDYVYYHEKSNVIFVGDVFDTSWHPTFYAGGLEGFDKAVNAILALGDKESLIVPGHGVPAYKPALKAFRENTFKWVSIIQELHKEGQSVESIMKKQRVKVALEKFNVSKQSPFIPENAFKRFVERTITVIEKEKDI